MKKSLFVLLMLAVVGMAMSCDREVAPEKPENKTPSDVQPNVNSVKSEIVGLWVLDGEINNQLGDFVYESTFRFGMMVQVIIQLMSMRYLQVAV